jgi:hypothetical protein
MRKLLRPRGIQIGIRGIGSSASYAGAYQNLLEAANQRLTRPLKDGFRMEGQLTTAKLDKMLLLPDRLSLALHASGELKILYGL